MMGLNLGYTSSFTHTDVTDLLVLHPRSSRALSMRQLQVALQGLAIPASNGPAQRAQRGETDGRW